MENKLVVDNAHWSNYLQWYLINELACPCFNKRTTSLSTLSCFLKNTLLCSKLNYTFRKKKPVRLLRLQASSTEFKLLTSKTNVFSVWQCILLGCTVVKRSLHLPENAYWKERLGILYYLFKTLDLITIEHCGSK